MVRNDGTWQGDWLPHSLLDGVYGKMTVVHYHGMAVVTVQAVLVRSIYIRMKISSCT